MVSIAIGPHTNLFDAIAHGFSAPVSFDGSRPHWRCCHRRGKTEHCSDQQGFLIVKQEEGT